MASATENRFINLYINGKQAGETLSAIRANYRRVSNEINRGKLSQQEYNAKVRELRQYGRILDEHRDKIRGVNRSWNNLKTIAAGVLGANLVTGAFQKITSFIPNLINQNAKLADSFADVRRTTNLSEEGVRDLSRRLRTIDTRTSREELLKLAFTAGKLGLEGVEDITQFVRAADKINVALGGDLGADAIRTLGKLNNLFKVSDVYGYEQGLLKLGSVINELGNSSEAQESAIVDFTSRLAGIASQSDIAYASIAAMGATLDSLGQRTETSGTAVSQAIVGMFKNTDIYAKIAGKSVDEFSKLMKEDANEAFIQFLQGLNGNNEGLEIMVEKFNGLGLNGSRAITVLSSLAGNTELLRKQQLIANKAFEEGISVTEEFNRKNESAAANLAKIQRAIYRLWVNSELRSGIESITASLARMVEIPISRNLEEQRVRYNGLMYALRDVNTPAEHRIDIIKQLKESFGDRIKNIDLETASYEELAIAQASANKQYIIEIALQQKKEDIQKAREKAGEKEVLALNREIDAGKLLMQTNEALGKEYNDLEEAIADLNKVAEYKYFADTRRMEAVNTEAVQLDKLKEAQRQIGGMTNAAAMAQDEYNKQLESNDELVEALKKKYPELAGVIDEVNTGMKKIDTGPREQNVTGDGTTTTGDEDKDIEKRRQKIAELAKMIQDERRRMEVQRLEDEERELAQADDHYNKLVERAEGFKDKIAEIEELREQAKDEIRQKWRDKEEEDRKEAEEKISEILNPDERHPEVIALEKKYDEMIALGEKYNIDVLDLITARDEAIAELQRKHDEAELVRIQEQKEEELAEWRQRMSLYQEHADNIVSVMQSANQMMAGETANFTKFQQQIGLISMGVSTGVALANAVKSASVVPFPGNLVAMSSAIAKVFALMAAAKEAFSYEEPPKYALGTGRHRGNAAIVGDQGPEMINLPIGAQVIPADLTQQILAANAYNRPSPQPNFAAINDNLTFSQSQQAASSSVSAQQGINLEPLTQKMDVLIAAYMSAQAKPVVLSYQNFSEFKNRVDDTEKRVVMKQ